ncbi:sulfotransferase [Flavimaricola sp.]|nr:sulfotransferase [Flavimaricola sp.]MDA9019760.1 sulfotransferase [Flavimaricola sp.]
MNGLPPGVGLVFCIGAQKSGTSWLYETLLKSRCCHFGPTKEMHYFDVQAGTEISHLKERIAMARRRVDALQTPASPDNEKHLRRLADLVDLLGMYSGPRSGFDRHRPYLKQMLKGHKGEKWLCDFTPSYAGLPAKVFAEMAGMGGARFIFVMRDPVARMWSQLRMWTSMQPQAPPPDSWAFLKTCQSRLYGLAHSGALPTLSRADYRRTILTLEQAVPAERIHYAFYEKLFSQSAVDRICDFLGVTSIPADTARRVNEGISVSIPPKEEALLRQAFATQYDFVQTRFGDAVPAEWQTGR